MTSGGPTDDPDPVAPAGLGRRVRVVLDQLRLASAPQSASEVAAATGLHLNTARFHLDRLVGAGLAVRVTERRDTPGRPRVLYSQRSEDRQSGYRRLARLLSGLVDELDGDGAAVSALGRRWGGELVDTSSAPATTAEAVTERLVSMMDEVGFESEVEVGDPAGTRVRIHRCPFVDVAQERPAVVCGLHLALMQGALDELGGPLEVDGLEPFAEPHACLARLTPRERADPRGSPPGQA